MIFSILKNFELNFKLYIIIFIIIFLFIICLFILRKYILKKLDKKKDKFSNKIKSSAQKQYTLILIVYFTKYLIFYTLLFMLMISLKFFNIFKLIDVNIIERIFFIILVISLIFPLFKITDLFLDNIFNTTHNKLASVSIIKMIAKIVIILIFVIIILFILKISITPILATFGLGGVTIAFAFKDFLTSFFAGFNLLFSHEIKIDDYIELNTGERGKIVDINWQYTKLLIFGNNVIYIPNTKLINGIIKNYNYPNKKIDLKIEMQIAASNDLYLVEKICEDAGKEIMINVEGAVPDFLPYVRFNQFDKTNITFGVFLRSKDYDSQFKIVHEFIKLINKRFKKNNIAFSYQNIKIEYPQNTKKDKE
ncbi:MAG: mechanosensitive ion channel family protein [Elusimicrobiota bacterium]|jgi:small-conductance mechanosensitive channel|nr:mechanosensitive ion channel family protein [Elusimicrobiota bacterium]